MGMQDLYSIKVLFDHKIFHISIVSEVNIRILHYNHRTRGDYRILWRDGKAKPRLFFMFSLSSSCSPLKKLP